MTSARQCDCIALYFNFIECESEPFVALKEISETGMSSREWSSSGTFRQRIATANDIRIAQEKWRPKRYVIGVSRVNPLTAMAHGACRLIVLTLLPPCQSSIRHHAGDP